MPAAMAVGSDRLGPWGSVGQSKTHDEDPWWCACRVARTSVFGASGLLFRGNGPDHESSLTGGDERSLGSCDGGGHQRFDLGSCQNICGLEPEETGLLAGALQKLVGIAKGRSVDEA